MVIISMLVTRTRTSLADFGKPLLSSSEAAESKWYGGLSCDASIVSSQVACLNCFFPFVDDSSGLRCWLSKLCPDLDDVLPISSGAEPPLPDGKQPFLTFEWIGEE